jgi:DNA-binding transcriptional regulator/RsmH inhibitor MraZ
VVIPAFLREYTGVCDEVVVAGVGSWVEVWSLEAWRAEQERFETHGVRAAEHLSIPS